MGDLIQTAEKTGVCVSKGAATIRGDVVWPSMLAQPPRPPAVVYLDLNHFIYLAIVVVGKIAPVGYPQLLAAARDAVNTGRAIFPLSATHLMEVSKIGKTKRRADVANVMAELSGFTYILGRSLIMELEIEASLSLLAGQDLTTVGPVDLIGYGGLWPFGQRMLITLVDDGGQETTQQVRAAMGPEAFDDTMAHANWDAQMLLLIGGDSGHPQATWRTALDGRAQREVGQVAAIDTRPNYRQSGLRDVINAAEAFVELNTSLKAGMLRSGLEPEQFFPTPQDARRFNDGMPSTRVAVSLKTHYHRNRQHNWTTNDMHDIDALAVAVPYCDAVFVDKAMLNGLTSSPELNLFGTRLPSTPVELADWLDQLPARAV
jgi:hypothetical protein